MLQVVTLEWNPLPQLLCYIINLKLIVCKKRKFYIIYYLMQGSLKEKFGSFFKWPTLRKIFHLRTEPFTKFFDLKIVLS